ncbi:MAG: hypothetical protein EXS51_01005 [Candidatus Taylorbacteria bacterium]|nr:hypothetical protein [Candidatus Taylorbacteria bacterium]
MENEPATRLLDVLQREPKWAERPSFAWLFRNSNVLLLCTILFALYGFFLSHPIDLVTADLGRHLKNGEMLLQDTTVLQENFYSYTNPNFHAINHHWGSGFLTYVVFALFGFTGVHLFFILLSFLALFMFLKVARLYAPWGVVGLAALPAIFLLAERTEIRPEVFSYLFAGFFFFLLSRFSEVNDQPEVNGHDRTYVLRSESSLWLLPVIQILWVNSHIYFLLGPLILGAFLLESLLIYRKRFLRLLSVFISVVLAIFINPYGYRALTEAVGIFKNYGYKLAENQSVWFMERIMADPSFLIFKIVFAFCLLTLLVTAVRNWRKIRLAQVFVMAGISIMAWFAIRNIALFGLFSIPFLASGVQTAIRRPLAERAVLSPAVFCSFVTLFLTVLLTLPRFFPYWHSFGFGLQKGNGRAIEFLQKEGVQGPYFNNYDIGGYLIFYLFPSEKVFVDNRPEAYPVEFFQKTYIPMQEDNAVWKEKLGEYRFNSIIFSHRDATPWGQHFMIQRLQDPEWAPVYVDERVLILVRRVEANKALIEKFLLPPETFRISA